ncbi:hypothetical protein EXU48_16785 [Occultella glacieicola]|uniref:Uncharacterized protein n=1 Tax=Occultella glacieicola TaxID=2518684 RepID=A0ABY2E1A6_9MICO|nr:hypothetical protein [Occultella glacieicola]TDE90775.1 hypothetical protein EXU48_16785 [Occultella glacieicola]
MRWSGAWGEAVGVFGVAGVFFVRHYPVVFAFGAVASAQRFLAVGGDERFAWAGGVGGEVVTVAVRVLFLVWVVRRVFADSDAPWSEVGDRLSRFLEGRTGVLLASAALLVALTIVAKVIPDAVAAGLETSARATFLSWELAIKNVSVIPFVMVWLTVLARHALTIPAARVVAGG